MKPDDKESGKKSDLLVKNHAVVIGIKEEVEIKHSKTNEPDREANIVDGTNNNIDVMNHEDEVESMQPNIEEKDTESNLLENTHPNVISIKEKDEDERSGEREQDRESNFVEDADTNIDDKDIGEMVECMQPDIKESDTKADLLVKVHSIVIDIIEEVVDEHSETKEPIQKSEIKNITSWRDVPKPLTATVCTKHTWNVGWSKGTAVLPTDKEKETVEEHLDSNATGGASGQIKIIADATNETDSESLKNIRLSNGRLEDDASTDFLEISEDKDQTNVTIRSQRTAHLDDWLSDEETDEIIYKVKNVINGKTAVKNAESHGETVKGTKEPDWNSNDLKVTNIDIVDIDQKETIEHMQPDVERSDTEPDPLAKTQPGVINRMKESGGKHSGSNEPNWKSNLLEDISIEIDDMSQGKMIVSILPDVERSDTKSDLLAENHCIVTGQKGEGKFSERIGPDQTSILSEDNSMNSDDMNQGDMVEEICSVGITQGKVIKGEYTRIEKPDRASIPLVKFRPLTKAKITSIPRKKSICVCFLK